MPLTMKYSNFATIGKAVLSYLSFPKTTQNLIAEPYLCLTQILSQLVDFCGQSKGNFNPGPPESSIGINLP